VPRHSVSSLRTPFDNGANPDHRRVHAVKSGPGKLRKHSIFVSWCRTFQFRISASLSQYCKFLVIRRHLGAEGHATWANARDGSKPGEPSEKPGTTLDFSRKTSPKSRASCEGKVCAHGQLPEPALDDVARRTKSVGSNTEARKQRIPGNNSSLVDQFRPQERIIAQITVQIAAPYCPCARVPTLFAWLRLLFLSGPGTSATTSCAPAKGSNR
jgi:hypothetical protein